MRFQQLTEESGIQLNFIECSDCSERVRRSNRSVSGANSQENLHPSSVGSLRLRQHVGDEESLLTLRSADAQRQQNFLVAVSIVFLTHRRVEVSAEVSAKVPLGRISEQQLLGLLGARRVDSHLDTAAVEFVEIRYDVVIHLSFQCSHCVALFPNESLQLLQMRELPVFLDAPLGVGNDGVNAAGPSARNIHPLLTISCSLHLKFSNQLRSGRGSPRLHQEAFQVLRGVREQHFFDESDGGGGALDIDDQILELLSHCVLPFIFPLSDLQRSLGSRGE
mmetsp:Transcript_33033/g.72754  ORF Transcript_33033/g.72754 Transcript_33033/m.72754 type:complete len:278 (+) Transcript_33033:1365-2198(+)